MTKLLAIFDNQKKIGICGECGASLRYEYVTDEGIFGSECVHKHIHSLDWITLKSKRDFELFQLRQHAIDTIFNYFTQTPNICYYFEYKDGSGRFWNFSGSINTDVAPIVLDKLIENGYTKTYDADLGHYKRYWVHK